MNYRDLPLLVDTPTKKHMLFHVVYDMDFEKMETDMLDVFILCNSNN